jgi:hypothetical protein
MPSQYDGISTIIVYCVISFVNVPSFYKIYGYDCGHESVCMGRMLLRTISQGYCVSMNTTNVGVPLTACVFIVPAPEAGAVKAVDSRP